MLLGKRTFEENSRRRSAGPEPQEVDREHGDMIRGWSPIVLSHLTAKEKIGKSGEIAKKSRRFAMDIAREYVDSVIDDLGKLYIHNKAPGVLTPSFFKKIYEKGILAPAFDIYGKTTGDAFLSSLGIDWGIDKNDILLVFNLPKPLAIFWRKGKEVEPAKGMIQWGDIYWRNMPVIWEYVGDPPQGLSLQRINENGQHDANKYYYLWEVSGL